MRRFAKPLWGNLHRGFESPPLRQIRRPASRAPVAQRIERQVADLKVVGSSPAGRANSPHQSTQAQQRHEQRVAQVQDEDRQRLLVRRDPQYSSGWIGIVSATTPAASQNGRRGAAPRTARARPRTGSRRPCSSPAGRAAAANASVTTSARQRRPPSARPRRRIRRQPEPAERARSRRRVSERQEREPGVGERAVDCTALNRCDDRRPALPLSSPPRTASPPPIDSIWSPRSAW